MKRLLGTMLASIFGIALSVGFASAASSDCLNFSFSNGDSMCLGISKNGTKNFKISIDKNNLSNNSEIKCYVILENSSMHTIKGCEGTFSYAGSSTEDVIINATYKLKNKNFYSKRISTEVNFNKGTWGKNNSLITSSKSSKSSSSSKKSSDDLDISVSPSSPDTYEWVKLTIETDDDYSGKINFSKFQYKSSSSSSWSNISRTSSTYVSDYSNDWSNGYYRMTSSDDGEATLKNLVKFKKSGYYRIYVEDTDGNESYVQINVDTSSSSSSSNGDLDVSVSPSSPDTYEWVKLTIETDDDYSGKINFSKFQYKPSSSSSWSNISRTSSTYVSDYSNDWSNGYYRMTSSDDGEATLKNLVKFKKAGYYRIYVEDTDGNESYVQINVDTSSSSSSSSNYSDEIELSTNRTSPSTSQYVNLTIETEDENYIGKLYLLAKYRSSSSNSWSNISNTSSTYFSDYSDEWEDGYYRMTSSDDGEVTLRNLVKFKKDGYYRISVIDIDGNENYIDFSVGDVDSSSSKSSSKASSVNGFTSSQLSKVKTLYNQWDNMISQLKKDYPSLKKDTYWIKLSDTFYNNMKDVINNKKSRNFDDYDDYTKAFNSRYKYTMNNK